MPKGKTRKAVGKALWVMSGKREKRHFPPTINIDGNIVMTLAQDAKSGEFYYPGTKKRFKINKKDIIDVVSTSLPRSNERKLVYLIVSNRRAK